MTRYIGELGTDVYGVTFDEGKIGTLNLTAAQTVAIDDDGVLVATAGSAVAAVTTNAGVTKNPPYPRNLVVTPGGTTAGVPADDVVVVGTNFADEVISEAFAFEANATAATVGALAFKTVTSVTIPQLDEAGATFKVGWGDKLGLPIMSDYNAVLGATVDGVRETTFPTVVFDADEIEKNTVDLNTALNGQVVKIFLAL
jgi:hypothetical protein